MLDIVVSIVGLSILIFVGWLIRNESCDCIKCKTNGRDKTDD
jgi:hypothetical protein